MTCPVLKQYDEHCLLILHLSTMSNDKEVTYTQLIWADPNQNSRI
jgi:hypothetical protein